MLLHFLHDAIGLKDSRHLFIQSEVKPKPIVTRSHAFSRALRQPHVITSSFDWFNVLSVSYVIGQSNYFGFGFTTLKRKPLYEETTMSRISPVKRSSVANPGYPHINKLLIGAVTLALSPKAPPGEIANSAVFSKRLS